MSLRAKRSEACPRPKEGGNLQMYTCYYHKPDIYLFYNHNAVWFLLEPSVVIKVEKAADDLLLEEYQTSIVDLERLLNLPLHVHVN